MATTTTLAQIRDQVILDAGIKNNPDFTPARLTNTINLAQRYVQTMLNGLGFKHWETSVSIGTPVAGFHGATAVATVPVSTLADMLESPASILMIETLSGTTKGIARVVDPNVFEEQISNTYLAPTASKPTFTRLSGNILLSPSTITAGTAHYYKSIANLSQDTDTSDIPMEFVEFVVKKAVNDVNESLGKLQNSAKATQELETRLAEVYQKFHGKQLEQNRNKIDGTAKLQ